MQLRIWRRIYLTPFVRLNIYTKGFTISFGHFRIGWLTFGRRELRATVPTGVPGVYLSERQRWHRIAVTGRRRTGSEASLEK
jgi:hypothetical protein